MTQTTMGRTNRLSPRQAVIRSALRMSGFDPTDFEIVEAAAPALGDTALSDDVLALRRRSTGDERLYLAGSDLPWFALIVEDLSQGRFGTGQRHGAPARAQ